MLILAVDTSLPVLSVALYASRVIGAVSVEGKESRNQKLLPAVDWLLNESGLERRAINILVVTRGPGSFTGVRVGLATVQGLAFALGIPAFALSTHEAAAEYFRDRDVVIHGNAGRGEYYVSGFRADEEVLPPVLMTREALDEFAAQFPVNASVEEMVEKTNIALLAAQRASRMLASGDTTRYGDMTPIYVRLAEAEVKLGRG